MSHFFVVSLISHMIAPIPLKLKSLKVNAPSTKSFSTLRKRGEKEINYNLYRVYY